MRTLVVVPTNPTSDGSLRLLKGGVAVLPCALLLEASEEALNEAILFGRVGSDVLLSDAVVPTRCSELRALEDQAVVAPNNWL